MNLKEIRLARGMTQQQLANKCETTQQSIALYETNQRDPSIDTLKKLCEVLHCTPNELLADPVKEEA